MPLDNASFITGLNPNNPNGAVDKVSSLDNHIREVKRAVTQSLPNIGGAVKYSHAELNDMRDNLTHTLGGTEWDVKDNALINVAEKDDDSAVEPRSYNDKRYLQIENNLSELSSMDTTELVKNLFSDSLLEELQKKLFEKQYPIGHVMINSNDSRNPETYLGFGKWKVYGSGRTLIGVGSSQDVNNVSRTFAAASQGGEYVHTLTVSEMVPHNHPVRVNGKTVQGFTPGGGNGGTGGGPRHDNEGNIDTTNTGGGQPFNVIQPYIVAYMWERYQ